MGNTVRLTAAQAMVRWLSVQMTEDGQRFIEGIWAIFGHGNVAGIGEALHAHRDGALILASGPLNGSLGSLALMERLIELACRVAHRDEPVGAGGDQVGHGGQRVHAPGAEEDEHAEAATDQGGEPDRGGALLQPGAAGEGSRVVETMRGWWS